jgi:hypothetical protein
MLLFSGMLGLPAQFGAVACLAKPGVFWVQAYDEGAIPVGFLIFPSVSSTFFIFPNLL